MGKIRNYLTAALIVLACICSAVAMTMFIGRVAGAWFVRYRYIIGYIAIMALSIFMAVMVDEQDL